MSDIHIGSVRMPLADFVVSRNALLGMTKSGKSYTAKGVAEQLLEHGIPIIVFDAIGVWRYLKIPGDGPHAKGFRVVVAGGEHPDLPLTPASAPEIVRAAIKENIPLIIDLYDSKLSKADWRRIVQACFRILLYENKGLRHVFLEESAEFAPQKVMDGETYAEVEKLARMGGNKHIGITFINQRAQELNKAVLELCDNVVLLRQRGSHAIDALEKWLDRLSPDLSKNIADSMPQMTQGDCWIFTESAEVPVRTRSGLIKSLHPDRRMPEQALSGRKSVDAESFVQKLSGELSKLFEEQKANDPGTLKKRIAELEREIKSKSQSPKSTVETKEISVFTDADRKVIESVTDIFEKRWREIQESIHEFNGSAQRVFDGMNRLRTEAMAKMPVKAPVRIPFSERSAGIAKVTVSNAVDGEMTGTQQKILDTIAMLGNRGLVPNREMVARWLGIHPNGSRYNTDLARLRERGLLDGCELTVEGDRAANAIETGFDAAMRGLEGTQQKILELLSTGNSFQRESLAGALGIHPNGSRYNTDLARLRTMGLIPDRGTIKLTEAAMR